MGTPIYSNHNELQLEPEIFILSDVTSYIRNDLVSATVIYSASYN